MYKRKFKESEVSDIATLLFNRMGKGEDVLAVAQKFVRNGEEGLDVNADRTFIYQIVSSYIDGPNNNASELVYKQKHPWIRVICGRDNLQYGTKKGDVFEIGYGWVKLSILPGVTSKGRFRTEDLWNYNSQVKH